ncbi:MAG: outer membrane lipoprotein-sorting protein [Spirochaetia bacterium]|jgi:outer membrane lipoprotein-sorting protein
MKHVITFISLVLLAGIACSPIGAQEAGLSAADILAKVDDTSSGARDQSYTMKLLLVDKDGKEKSRELTMLQKGRDKRLVRFLSPADQRGIAFLSLPNDVQYVYLPAFGKARRIASHVKNTSFAGTDFTYEDMEAVRMTDKWEPRIQKQEKDTVILELTPKPGKTSDYSRLLMWVRTDNWCGVRIEHYDRSGALVKIMLRENLQQVQGYWVAMATSMEDLRKKHTSKMLVSDLKLDTGIADEKFSERALLQ